MRRPRGDPRAFAIVVEATPDWPVTATQTTALSRLLVTCNR